MTQQEWLRRFAKKHKLSRKEISEVTETSIFTVNSWFLPDSSKASRKMPESAKKLLLCELRNRNE